MYDGDDIDLLYVLSSGGWSTCLLFVNRQIYELDISHSFGNPIGDLIEATVLMMKGDSTVELTWWNEPGGNRWRMTRNPAKRHLMKVVVTEFPSHYSFGDEVAGEIMLVEFEIKINQFAKLVYYQMKKLAALLKEKSFEKNRSGDFPYQAFFKLESFFGV
ncbi:hypothetical protein LEP3755_52730 [Leptolyngbya sp. NIES-3755]|nr:hypothetical protein LEP3755_52730 [Leptolyngbya sp. NIES-3755]